VRWTAAALILRCAPGPLVAPGDAAVPSGCPDLRAPPDHPCRPDAFATVRRVVDGDTLDVSLDGAGLSRVRLIGFDAPEHDEGACGAGAQEHLDSLAPAGTRLVLVFDAECQDAYGRDLAYAWAGDRMLNAAMLGDGFAQACPYQPNTTYAAAFRCLGENAEAEGSGLWALGCHRDPCFE